MTLCFFLRVRIVGLDNIRNADFDVLYIEAGIYHGGELLGDIKFSSEISVTSYPRWNQWLVFETQIKCLPKAARLCLQVFLNVAHLKSVPTVLVMSQSLEDVHIQHFFRL